MKQYFGLTFLLIGCSSVAPEEDPVEQAVSPTEESSGTRLSEELLGEVALEDEEKVLARRRVRMNVSQLNQSMQQITGVEWKSGNTVLWDRYSSTLGVPDFQERTSEDLEASVIFQKFLQDAATYTCEYWIDNESEDADGFFYRVTQTDGQDPSIIRTHIEDLRYVVHGAARDSDGVFIDNTYDLYHLVYQRTEDSVSAWKTVCVALFTHPDFYTY